MENQPVAMKHCSNCKRDVAEGNFVMHEVHCRKNIVLCSKCSEPVPKTSMEAHIEENHALVDCELCSCLVERSRMEEHKRSLCSKRCQICAFCQLSVPADELGKHESYCGTRTEPCTKCLQYIMHKDRAMHEESDCRLPERIESAPKVAVDPFERVGFDHPDYWSDYRSFANEVRRSDFGRGGLERFMPDLQLGGFRSCVNTGAGRNRAGADRLYQDVQAEEDELCNDFLKFAQAKKSNTTNDPKVSKDVHTNLNPLQDVSLVPCEFCDEIFPAEEIFEHQVICSSQFDELDSNLKRNYGPNLLRNPVAEHLPPKRSYVESVDDEVAVLPCEFCEDLYPTEDLMFHQMNCEVRQLIASDEPEVIPEDLRRPPSLPSGLNRVDTVNNSPSPLKPSSSIPLHLSQLGMASNPSSSSSVPQKPISTASGYRHKDAAASGTQSSYKLPSNLVKTPATKQLEDRTGHNNREVQSGRQSMEGTGIIPVAQILASARNMAFQEKSLASRSGAGDAARAPQRMGGRGKPTSVTEIPTSTLPESNHSRVVTRRPTGPNLRPTGSNRTDHITNRPAVERQEGGVGCGRPSTLAGRSNSQQKNSRSLPEPPSKS